MTNYTINIPDYVPTNMRPDGSIWTFDGKFLAKNWAEYLKTGGREQVSLAKATSMVALSNQDAS